MPCRHKFFEYLNCSNINYQPQIMIIGTFNPEWPDDNYAEWFYGRTNNNYFWETLPRMFNEVSLRNLNHSDWKHFCAQKKIAITDLISSINDANQEDPTHFEIISKFKDTEFAETFNSFEMTNIIEILENNPSIKKVFFTRNPGVVLFDNQIEAIREFCNNNHIHFSHLLTPSKNARFQMRGWNPKMPNLERNLSNFIYEKWLINWNKKYL
jgi:hypothetical protein